MNLYRDHGGPYILAEGFCTPACHRKWLRVEVGAVGNLAQGHFNHTSDPSEINSTFATLQKAQKLGKEKQCLSCKQTPMSGCIYRLWADREGAIREFFLGNECECDWEFQVTILNTELLNTGWWSPCGLGREIFCWMATSANAQGLSSCRPGWGHSLHQQSSTPIYAEGNLLKWQTVLRLV